MEWLQDNGTMDPSVRAASVVTNLWIAAFAITSALFALLGECVKKAFCFLCVACACSAAVRVLRQHACRDLRQSPTHACNSGVCTPVGVCIRVPKCVPQSKANTAILSRHAVSAVKPT